MDAASGKYSYITSQNVCDNITDRANAEYYEKKYFGDSVLENLRKDTLVKSTPRKQEANITLSKMQDSNPLEYVKKNFIQRNLGNILKAIALIATPIVLIKGGKKINISNIFNNMKVSIKKIFTKQP